jgi:hypothetical protein
MLLTQFRVASDFLHFGAGHAAPDTFTSASQDYSNGSSGSLLKCRKISHPASLAKTTL